MKKKSKFIRMGSEEFKSMVRKAMKEEPEDETTKADDSENECKEEEGTTVQDIVEEALDRVNEKRKSRKEAGEEVGDITEEEILEAVAEVVEEISGEETMGEDDPDGEEKEDPEEGTDEEKRKGRSGQRQVKQRKAAPPVQRKYSNFYLLNGAASPASEKKSVPPLIQLARAVKCYDVFGRHDPEAAAFYAKKYYQDVDMEREFKALNTTNPSAGGYLIPEVYLDQIIELLYSKTVVFELGAQRVPMPNGNVNIPKMTAGARAKWGGEQRKIATTSTAFGNLKLFAKRLEAIIPQSRELMMSTSYSADQLFGNDLARRMELGQDYGALYGTGTEYQPLGIKNNKGITKIDVSKLTDEALAVDGMITADFPIHMRSQVMYKNVDDQKLGWAFNSLVEGYLMNLKTTTGTYIYREEMAQGKLLGAPYKISNQIEFTKEGTDIFFGNWSDLIEGDQMGLETYTTLDGSWTDDAGVPHSAFDENLAATRALMYLDLGVRHEESFLVATNCKVPGVDLIIAGKK